MPWRCPACAEQIRHSAAESEPRPGVLYRCHVCRLELTLDTVDKKLRVPAIDRDESATPKAIPDTVPMGKAPRRRAIGSKAKSLSRRRHTR